MRVHGKIAMWEIVMLMYDKKALPEPWQKEAEALFEAEDKTPFFNLLMGEITDRFMAVIQDMPPDPNRGLEGDLNPCEICGMFGGFQVGTGWGIMLCQKHKTWWDEEYYQFHERKT